MENDAEIFPAHYTRKETEKGFKMASMVNKLAMINSCEIIIEKYIYIFFAKNHCEIQVRTILVCLLYLIKYGIYFNVLLITGCSIYLVRITRIRVYFN
jgi:hypothetical protein